MHVRLNRRQFVALAGSVSTAFMAAPAAIAAPSDAAEFYRGKALRILVGSPPGGGYDIYARLVAPALAAKLGAEVLVENKAGNGGLAALATLLTRPADGLTIMNGSAEAAILSQMLGRPGVTWDVVKLNGWQSSPTAPKLWFAGKIARYQTIADTAKAAADLVGDRACRRHQRRAGDHLLRARAAFQDRRRLSRLRRHVARGHQQRGRLRPAVGRLGAAAHRFDQAARLVRRQALVAICPTCRPCAKPRALPADKAWIVDLREKIGEAQRAMVAAPGVPPTGSTICAARSPKSSPIRP